ncbi:MAG: zinc-binding dehydrogenase [Candidatus Magasanikbacteria bacterium]
MKALIYDATKGPWSQTRGFWMSEIENPVLGAQEKEHVIVKMKYAGFCGSDRGIWSRVSFGEMIESSLRTEGKSQRTIGHELLGEIVEIGADVQEKYSLRIGDIVSAESHITCGTCYQCAHGDKHVCADDIIIGIAKDGCFAEYVKLPAKIMWKTDVSKIDPRIGAIQEPFGNAVHACTQVDLKDKTVAVFGSGAIGSLVIMVAKGMGAKKIIAIDTSDDKLDMARAVGADETVTLNISPLSDAKPWQHNISVTKRIKELTNGVGVDVAMDMAGPNASVNNAIQSVRRGGHVVLFGLKSGDFVIENFETMIRNGVQIHSVIGRQIWETWETTKKLLEDPATGIQEKIKKYVMKDFEGSVVKFHEFERESFEEKMKEYPKLIFDFLN